MMNRKLKNLKTISCLFAFLIFFQSCKVYRYTSINLEDVYKQKQSVKIITTNNKVLKFYKVDKTDGTYYGYKSKKHIDRGIKVAINPNQVKNIKVYKDIESVVSSVATITGIIISIVALKAIGENLIVWKFE